MDIIMPLNRASDIVCVLRIILPHARLIIYYVLRLQLCTAAAIASYINSPRRNRTRRNKRCVFGITARQMK